MTFLVGAGAFAVVGAVVALRPHWPARLPTWLVPAAAAAAAAALAFADAAPTGWQPLDLVARAGVAAAVVLSAARTGGVWTLWLATVAGLVLVVADGGSWEPAGAAALGVALAALVSGVLTPGIRAVAAALAVASLANLSWPVVTGAPSLAVAAAVIPVLLAGAARAPRRVQSALPWAVAALFVVAVGGSVAGGLAALQARTDVNRAVDAALAGLDELDAEETERAAARLELAAEAFGSAESTMRTWWARSALLVPGVAQQSRAVSTMAGAGRELSLTAARSLAEVDFDTLRPVDGQVDLAAVDDVTVRLVDSLRSLRRADDRLSGVRSPLLVTPVADRLDDLSGRVAETRAAAETAAAALEVAPDLLGRDGPRHYFLVMHTPSELRGVGGFMGSWGELVIDGGRFELVRTGRVRELTNGGPDPEGRRIEGHADFVGHWGQAPAQYWGIIGFSPDFPTVGSIITQLYPQSGGGALDGVIALDPAGFAALLELSGPISVEGHPEPLTPENAEEILLHDQYLGEDEEDREAFLEASIRALFDELTSGALPGPSAIAAELAPMVDARRVQLYSRHDPEQRFFERIEAAGGVARRVPDAMGVVGQNYNGNKIDYFLRRSVTYDVEWDPSTGRVEGTVEVHIQNLAPASGLPHSVIGWGGDVSAGQVPVADGENLMYLTLYSAASLADVTVDDEPAVLNRTGEELGYRTTDLLLRVPPGGVRVVSARVHAQIEPGGRYELELLRQPTATPDALTARVRVPDGWRFVASGDADVETEGTEAARSADATSPFRIDLSAERAERTILDRLAGR